MTKKLRQGRTATTSVLNTKLRSPIRLQSVMIGKCPIARYIGCTYTLWRNTYMEEYLYGGIYVANPTVNTKINNCDKTIRARVWITLAIFFRFCAISFNVRSWILWCNVSSPPPFPPVDIVKERWLYYKRHDGNWWRVPLKKIMFINLADNKFALYFSDDKILQWWKCPNPRLPTPTLGTQHQNCDHAGDCCKFKSFSLYGRGVVQQWTSAAVYDDKPQHWFSSINK